MFSIICFKTPEALFANTEVETSYVPYQVVGLKPQESTLKDIQTNEDESVDRIISVETLKDEHDYTLKLLRQTRDHVNNVPKLNPIEWIPNESLKCSAKVYLVDRLSP